MPVSYQLPSPRGNAPTDARLAHLAEDVAQALYALSDSAGVVDEPIDGFQRLVRVDIERGVIDIRVERGTLRW